MRFIKTIKSRHGASIGEMLTALLIMALLSLTVAGGAAVALKGYRTQILYSESKVLANSILVAIAEELRYATDVNTSGHSHSVAYDSRTYGAGAVMEIEPWTAEAGGGRLKIRYDKEEDPGGGWAKTDYSYGDATYTGLHIEAVEGRQIFQLAPEADRILISYNICDGRGRVWASVKDLELRILNGSEE